MRRFALAFLYRQNVWGGKSAPWSLALGRLLLSDRFEVEELQ